MKVIIRSKLPPKNTAPPPKAHLTRDEYLEAALDELLWLAHKGDRFTSDDVIRRVAQYGHQRDSIGFLFSWAVRQKVVRVVDRVPSSRPESRPRKIGQYVGTPLVQKALQKSRPKKRAANKTKPAKRKSTAKS